LSVHASADLTSLGWDERVEMLYRAHPDTGLQPGRVVRVDVDRCVVATSSTTTTTAAAASLPVVGDWVLLEPRPGADPGFAVAGILERHGTLTRPSPDPSATDRVVAANVDVVGIVTGLDRPPNLRRLEREVVVATGGGARPMIVLTKADLHSEPRAAAEEVGAHFPAVDVLVTNALEDDGVEALARAVRPNLTLVLVGASGVGKSTLVNRLVGSELMATNEVREGDRKGRHTTTARHLIALPGGGVLIDTPGVRSVALSADTTGIAIAYDEIEEVATRCRFSDCRHQGEPGCAVAAAVAEGVLDSESVARYLELSDEAARVEAAGDPREQAERRRNDRVAQRTLRKRLREKKG
jgi:ribosome biogenesis GTPase